MACDICGGSRYNCPACLGGAPEPGDGHRTMRVCRACHSYYCDRLYPAVAGLTPPPCRGAEKAERRAS